MAVKRAEKSESDKEIQVRSNKKISIVCELDVWTRCMDGILLYSFVTMTMKWMYLDIIIEMY